MKISVFFYVKSIEIIRVKNLLNRKSGVIKYGNDMLTGSKNLMEDIFLIQKWGKARKASYKKSMTLPPLLNIEQTGPDMSLYFKSILMMYRQVLAHLIGCQPKLRIWG